MADPQYFPSDYAFVPAIPLQYLDDPSTLSGRPVPLSDLFPVFASSPSVTKSTPVPVVEACTARYTTFVTYGHNPLDSTASSLSLCVLDKCRDPLGRVSDATYEALLLAASGDKGPDPDLQKHFNSYNALEECTIRHCPTEYFASRSSLCVSLRHPYFVKRNIFLPALPPHRRQFNTSSNLDFHFAEYLARVRSPQSASPISKDSDFGIRFPALPAGFPCDHTHADKSSGAIVRGNTAKATAINMHMMPAGTWVTSAGGDDQAALSHNATDVGFVHTWMAKSSLFRGHDGLGEAMASQLRDVLATSPANMYSLGHCPRSTGRFTGSKLAGDECASSIECVFSMCVNGKCAEAASGKQLDAATAVRAVRDTWFREADRAEREEAQFWMLLGGGLVVGLLVLRAVGLAVKRRWVVRKREEVERRRLQREPPAFEAQQVNE